MNIKTFTRISGFVGSTMQETCYGESTRANRGWVLITGAPLLSPELYEGRYRYL